MKQNFSNFFSARFLRAVQLCALLGILLSFSSNAWGTCYLIDNGGGSVSNVKSANTVVYTASLDANNTGTISFSMTSNNGLGQKVTVQYSTNNGSSWTDASTIVYSNGTKTNQSATIGTQATNVRFINKDKTTFSYNYSISAVYLERAVSFSTDANSVALGTTSAGKSKSNSVAIAYNAMENQSITSSITGNNASLFSCTFSNNTLDCSGTVAATVSFNPLEDTPAGDYSCTISISAGSKNISLPVTAKVTQATITSINWGQSFMSLSIYDDPATIDLSASVVDQQGHAVPGANVVYSLGDDADGVVSLNGNQLNIVGVGETTITATFTTANEDQYTSSSNTKRIVVGDGSACETLVVDESNQKDCNSATFMWNAPADKLNLQYKKLSALTITGKMYVDAYNASGNKTRLATYDNSSTSWKNASEIQLDRSYRKIVVTASTEEGSHYVQNVTVTQATYLEAVSTSLNATGEGVASTSVSFNFSNLPSAVSASLEGNHDEILLDPASVGEGCGDWQDGATMHLTFSPNGSGRHTYSYNGNLVLSAGSGENITSVKIPLSVTISMPYGEFKNGLAMFYNANDVALDTHTSAYWAEWNVDNTTLSIHPVAGQNVAAEMPVLLVGDGTNDIYTFTKEDELTLTPEANNAFYYTSKDETAVDPVVFFVLGVKDDVAAFYKFTGEVPAGKVVLKMTKTDPQAAVPARIDIELNEQTATALRPIYTDEQQAVNDGKIYTIMGLPVSSMDQPGIYIMNGKKYIVR